MAGQGDEIAGHLERELGQPQQPPRPEGDLEADSSGPTAKSRAGELKRLKKELDAERKVHERSWERREDAYNELSQNAAAVDERIRQVIEQRPELSTGLAELPAS